MVIDINDTADTVRVMDELGIKGAQRKEYVDQIAAEFILQSYLDSLKLKTETGNRS